MAQEARLAISPLIRLHQPSLRILRLPCSLPRMKRKAVLSGLEELWGLIRQDSSEHSQLRTQTPPQCISLHEELMHHHGAVLFQVRRQPTPSAFVPLYCALFIYYFWGVIYHWWLGSIGGYSLWLPLGLGLILPCPLQSISSVDPWVGGQYRF